MKNWILSLKFLFILTLLTGLLYPLLITGIVQLIFPYQSNGSIITRDGQNIGSELIAQKTDSLIYFQPRPSAVSYNPLPSGGSNLGLTSKKLRDTVNYRSNRFILLNHLDNRTAVPSEMVFASGSGLDPDISPEAALLQADRIAKARNFNNEQKNRLNDLIRQNTQEPQFGILGQARINVLKLNLELDKLK